MYDSMYMYLIVENDTFHKICIFITQTLSTGYAIIMLQTFEYVWVLASKNSMHSSLVKFQFALKTSISDVLPNQFLNNYACNSEVLQSSYRRPCSNKSN